MARAIGLEIRKCLSAKERKAEKLREAKLEDKLKETRLDENGKETNMEVE